MTDPTQEQTYRISRDAHGHHPEMLYWTKNAGEQWVPLNREGYWADPEAYSTGVVTKRPSMTEQEAQTAIWRARKANRT